MNEMYHVKYEYDDTDDFYYDVGIQYDQPHKHTLPLVKRLEIENKVTSQQGLTSFFQGKQMNS